MSILLVVLIGVTGLAAIILKRSGWKPKFSFKKSASTSPASPAPATSSKTKDSWVKTWFGHLIMIGVAGYIGWALYTNGDRVANRSESNYALADALSQLNKTMLEKANTFSDTMIVVATQNGSESIIVPKGAKVRWEALDSISFAVEYTTEDGKTGTVEYQKEVRGEKHVPANTVKITFISREVETVNIIFMSTKPLEHKRVGPNESPRITAGAVTYLFFQSSLASDCLNIEDLRSQKYLRQSL